MSGLKTAVSPKRMKEDFELVKEKIRIEEMAQYLLGEPVRNMYYYPEEKTPSIKIYPKTQSFYDFGQVPVAIVFACGLIFVKLMHGRL